MTSPHLLELSGIGNPGVLPSRRDSGAARIVRHRENYRDDYAPRLNWQVTMPVTLDGQTRGVAHVKEIVK
jgi:hypothetical protein